MGITRTRFIAIAALSVLCLPLVSKGLVQAAGVAFFVSNVNLNEGDARLAELLEEFGHEVTPLAESLDPFDQLFEADDADLVVVSESVTSGNIGSNLNDTQTPIIVYEPYVFDDMMLTGPNGINPGLGGGDFGFSAVDQTDITIVSPSHPMAAGLPAGDVTVYADPIDPEDPLFAGAIISWGVPSDDADVIARPAGPDGEESAAIFVYDQGDSMVGGTAAGIRIGYHLHNRTAEPTLLTDDGIALLKAAVDYALGIGQAPMLQAGDSDMDLDFDQLDLVRVQVAAKYLTGQPATWGEGDWNGAPGGQQGSPPLGDGEFNQRDIIAALGHGLYLTGPYASLQPNGTADDAQTSVGYNATTGEVWVDAPAGQELTSINIDSAAGIFTGDPAQNLGGSFDNDADDNIFKATFGGSFGTLTFGHVAQAGLSEEFVRNDLSVVGSLAGGGDLGDVDLIYVPEPATVLMLALGLISLGAFLGTAKK